MPAPRKPANEKHVNRWMSFRPDISAYLDSLPVGQKSLAVNEAIAATQWFREWKDKQEVE